MGMPSTVMAKSVPWSRLNPRRKYWLALPSPECWVTTMPGTVSSSSPRRRSGLSSRSTRPTAPCDALLATPSRSSARPRTTTSGNVSVPSSTAVGFSCPQAAIGRALTSSSTRRIGTQYVREGGSGSFASKCLFSFSFRCGPARRQDSRRGGLSGATMGDPSEGHVGVAKYRVIPDRSQLWAEARSSLHPINVETSGLTGEIDAEVEGQSVRLGAPFRVEIDAEKLKSGNGLVDGELSRRLDTRRFPRVTGAVKASDGLPPPRWRLRGDLTLHGVTRETDAEVTARVIDADTIEIEGEKTIDMRDYGLTPPKFLMFRVHPDVKVRARLVAKKQA